MKKILTLSFVLALNSAAFGSENTDLGDTLPASTAGNITIRVNNPTLSAQGLPPIELINPTDKLQLPSQTEEDPAE